MLKIPLTTPACESRPIPPPAFFFMCLTKRDRRASIAPQGITPRGPLANGEVGLEIALEQTAIAC
jgi:hypothetical protein